MDIKERLYRWRDNEANKKGIEAFRVLPNSTLDEISNVLPKTKDELCSVKGVKEMKFAQYGEQILQIVNGIEINFEEDSDSEDVEHDDTFDIKKEKDNFLTVGEYLNLVNSKLQTLRAKVKGEVVSAQVSGSAIYFTIKDSVNEGTLSVFMWVSDYRMSGVTLAPGLEVLVGGHPEIYKPTGRFSLRASTLELIGEGALKKAYDELKKKLEKEGLFAESRKRKLADYPTRIGLITSRQGAVIHDFLNNLGQYGYSIKFVDSRVEGVLAIKELLGAIKQMKKEDIDTLVIIRGGGSLESLQAFNNELIVREIANFKVPVICAIGHDKDVPLAQLVSDYAPSTPSICTSILNESWNVAKYNVDIYKQTILSNFESALNSKLNIVNRAHSYFERSYISIQNKINTAINTVNKSIVILQKSIEDKRKTIDLNKNRLIVSFNNQKTSIDRIINQTSSILDAYNPINQLKIGYSILYSENKVLKSVKNAKLGSEIEVQLSDGKLTAEVTNIKENG